MPKFNYLLTWMAVCLNQKNTLIASVSSTGKVSGKIIGDVVINITNSSQKFSAKCNVTITPQYQMYHEPYMNFGVSASQIKSYETRRIFGDTSTGIMYEGENSQIAFVMYALENSRLKNSAALIPYSSPNGDLLVDFIWERYTVIIDESHTLILGSIIIWFYILRIPLLNSIQILLEKRLNQ